MTLSRGSSRVCRQKDEVVERRASRLEVRGSCATMNSVGSMRIFVRPATAEDGPSIGVTHAASWQAGFEHIFDADFLERAVTGRRQAWRVAISNLLTPPNLVLSAGFGNRVLAFSHSEFPDNGSAAEIFAFYCHPQAWGSGLAAALIDQTCAALATTASHTVLWTPTQAHRARRFYERSGFRLTGRARSEELDDWGSSPTCAEVPAVEYRRALG